ncbi:cupin domain-containing protein [Metallosphaera hakonensis]|uniref:Cupin domain-containing protein n=1 Tax=Metallosphaera hakonensis JCM 8857 = DSM 7519 TaxID=1293036 RepID=A0A2U9IQX2_9CREN|nr:cupin domain-containing protein [Metallosphaera hakonensis]AWR98448.1 cupin domain-containing protein [Metallosphaera hakonensis JCM 8857 = DSM 7519]
MDFHVSRIVAVPKSEVLIKGSKGAFIQWLVTKDHGAHYAVRKFSLEPGGSIGMHTHKYQETVIITKGKCSVCVNNQVYELEEGDFIFINGGVKHGFKNKDEALEFFCIIDYPDDMTIVPVDEKCP